MGDTKTILTQTGTPNSENCDNIAAFLGPANSEINNIEVDLLDTSKADEQNNEEMVIEKEANEIYSSGNAIDYMTYVCQKLHTGDRIPQMAIILAFANIYVINSKGIHIFLTGSAGSGKSHCAETVLDIFPHNKALKSKISDKALFRIDIPDETMIMMDDQDMSSTLGEIFKNSSTNWNKPYQYYVTEKVNGVQTVVHREAPKRCPFCWIKANITGDEQTLDRQLKFEIKNDIEQLKAIRALQNNLAINPYSKPNEHSRRVARKIWELVNHETVSIPYANDIVCKNLEKTRVYNLMLELTNSFAVLAAPKRNRDDCGYIEASIDDFQKACMILNSKEGTQNDNLGPEAKELLEKLRTLQSGDYFFKEIRDMFKFSSVRLTYALHGRDKENPGMGGLCSLPQVGTRGSGRENIVEWNKELDIEMMGDNFSLFSMDDDKLEYWRNFEKKKLTFNNI